MLRDVLESLSRAAVITLRTIGATETGLKATVTTEFEHPACLSGVIVGQRDPVRSIVLSCDQRLAQRLTQCLMSTDMSTDTSDRTAAAFQVFCSVFQQSLRAEAPWFIPTSEVLFFGPGNVSTAPSGDRFFDLTVRINGGSLHVLINLSIDPVQGETITVEHDQAIETDTSPDVPGPLHGDALEKIFTAQTEIDVQVELPVGKYAHEVHHAVILGKRTLGGQPVVLIALPHLSAEHPPFGRETSLRVFLALNGRIYQFQSSFAGPWREPLGPNAEMPLFALQAPTTLTPGQRRRTYRVLPHARLEGRVSRWLLDEKIGVYETAAETHGVVQDISVQGVRIAAKSATVLVDFMPGNLVLCQLQLEPGSSGVEVPGIIRRAQKNQGDAHPYDLGIEFIINPAWKNFQEPLERIREYVMKQQRHMARARSQEKEDVEAT